MYWTHQCSKEWLQARKNFLTASEIASVVPVTATGRKRSAQQVAEAMRNLYASKHSLTTDTMSSGAAARGHVLEPYAIKEVPNMYHWDDAIVVNQKYPMLGYSPDGMSLEQLNVGTWPVYYLSSLPHIEKIIEVKSYSPDKHIALGTTDLKSMPERWQLAVGMMVTEAEEGELIGFNPEMNEDLQVIHRYFDFDTFKDEMAIIDETLLKWEEFCKAWSKDDAILGYAHKASTSYETIIKEYVEQQSLTNPQVM